MNDLSIKLICPQIDSIGAQELPIFRANSYFLKPFDSKVIAFLNTLSKRILANDELKRLPEMVALGFWLRKTNIEQLKVLNSHLLENKVYFSSPLGKIFHICPANVDTMFLYSLAVSLLMGNKNILRISNRLEAHQIFTLFNILNSVLAEEEFGEFDSYINLVSYPHNENINNFISYNVNARVIWGGDQTIDTFKKFTTSPRVKDIVFADRISVLLIKCKSFLELNEDKLDSMLNVFFNDAYTFDQMGCSSPQTIYLLGTDDEVADFSNRFLPLASAFISQKYTTDFASIASLKLNRLVDDSVESILAGVAGDNLVKFAFLNNSVDETYLHGCGAGYFYVRQIHSASQLLNLQSAKIQTISHWGLATNDLLEIKKIALGEGIDRIVPLGEALNFNFIWDGYNLFDELSRKVFLKLN